MVETIRINVSSSELEERRARVECAKAFGEPDRVPVMPGIATRYWLKEIGVSFLKYFNDPATMYEAQLRGMKWVMENIQTDQYEIFGAWAGAWVDFQNTSEPSALGCEVFFEENQIPWTRGGWVKTDDDLEKLERIDITRNGLHGRALEFRKKMREEIPKYQVVLADGKHLKPEDIALTYTTDGPFTNAYDLMGDDIFIALYERPEFVERLLDIVTRKIIEWIEFCKEELGLPKEGLSFTDDTVALLSPDLYEKYVLPFDKRIVDHFGGWSEMHMCGPTEHLLELFANKLGINAFTGFSNKLNPDKVVNAMSGKLVLIGNVDPINLYKGTPDSVIAETKKAIETYAPHRGYIVSDGFNIAPGTPVENINAMMEAARMYGRYPM